MCCEVLTLRILFPPFLKRLSSCELEVGIFFLYPYDYFILCICETYKYTQ